MRALVVVMLAGCVVTRPPRVEERPRWHLAAPAAYRAGCLEADAWIRKSGKTGLGMTLRLRSTGDCSVAVTDARIVFGKRAIHSTGLAKVELPGRSQLYAWLPVKFDNDEMWNTDRNDAVVELDVVIAGQPAAPWTIRVHQQ